MSNRTQIEALLRCVKDADSSGRLVLDAKPGANETVKRFNSFLKRVFGISIHKTSKMYILRHTDEFADFLAQDQKIKEMQFPAHVPLYSKENDLTDAERLYLCDYNYYYLPEDQRLSAIRTDLADL